MKDLFLPRDPSRFDAAAVERFFANWPFEERLLALEAGQADLMRQVMLEKFLNPALRPFFLYHFTPLVRRAVGEMFAHRPDPRILELGCGSGSLSLLFALLGARVTAVDLSEEGVEACRRRQRLYETQAGPLRLEFRQANAFELDYPSLGPVDAIYSLFAFNMMQPTRELVPRMMQALGPDGKVLISDGNRQSLYLRLMKPRPTLTPPELSERLRQQGCRRTATEYHCVMPPVFVRHPLLYGLGRRLEGAARALGLMPWLGVSYTLLAERSG